MSADGHPRDGDDEREPEEESHLDTSETSGLGLTEEFARIEAEIEDGIGGEGGTSERESVEPYEGEGEEDLEPIAAEDEDEDDFAYEDEEGDDFGGEAGDGEIYEDDPEDLEGETGEAAVYHPDTAEEWATAEEAAAEPARWGETGEHDAVPDTGEWAGDAVADGDQRDADDADQAVEDEQPVSPSEAHTQVQRPEDADEAGDAEEPAALAAAGATEVRPPTAGSGSLTPIPPSQPPVTGEPPGPGAGDEDLDLKVPSLWLRFLSGSVLIVASVAAAVAVAGLLFLSDVAAKLQPIPGIQEQLDQVDPGDPQTILIIGSDRRASDPEGIPAHSDTTMLLRVDPEKDILSLFSLPRDLKVNIPGVGVRKLNEAYTIGGSEKTLKTVAATTGIPINHIVEINFDGFAEAVNEIDCVYIDVDRDYFNDNSTALPGEEYSAIDISAGYQRLCGEKALQYVRYRHTDTDLVRAARQQDFLREARQKVEPRELIPGIGGTGNELIDIFTSYTRSDIDNSADVLGILKSFIDVREVPVNKIEFKGDIGDATNTYVTSTGEQMEAAIDEFLNGPPEPVEPVEPDGGGGDGGDGGGEKKKEGDGGGSDDPLDGADVVPTEDLIDDETGETQAQRFEADANKNFRRLEIPVFYPKYLAPGSAFDEGSRTYEYENEDDKKEEAYKTVIALTTPSTLTEYYGVMGTTWDDPPILRNPTETWEYEGREYLLFRDGDSLRMVGWREDGNSYWLNNTLAQTLGEKQMLAIATSMGEVS